MPRKPKKELSMMEKTDYEVLREYIENGFKCVEIRLINSGIRVTGRTPIRSAEEQKAADDRFVEACFRLMYPDKDLSGCQLRFIPDKIKYAPDYHKDY